MRTDLDFKIQNFSPPRPRSKPRRGKISLIAIQEEVQSPFPYGTAGARRIKFVRIEQESGTASALALPQEWRASAMPTLRRDLLQPRSPREFEGQLEGKNIRVRAVEKMMRDEAGNFYERRGRQLRPLGELVLDDAGKVFEICPAGEIESNIPTPGKANVQAVRAAQEAPANGKNQVTVTPQPTEKDGCVDPVMSPQEKTVVSQLPAYQKLFADPGIRLQLAFGRVKREISGQLQHPERLQEKDVVECYAQFYEAHQSLPVARVAAAEFGNAALQSQLYFLTKGKAQLLGVPQLFKTSPQPFAMEATTRELYPNQCVYQLRPIFDPTLVPAPKTAATIAETPQELKREIPVPFLSPAQFKYSREEVLYDMKTTLGTLPPECALKRWFWVYLLRLLKTAIIVLTTGKQMKKWRAMLAGKSLDAQLWSVRPPAGFAYHPTVKQWAEETLLRAGYDAEYLLLEWEIFWRRIWK